MDNWKFGELEYTRPDFEAAKTFVTGQIEKIKNATSADEVFSAMAEADDYMDKLRDLYTIISIRHTLDTKDKFYEEENEWFGQMYPLFSPISVEYVQTLANSPFRKDIEAKYGKTLFTDSELSIKSFCEKNIPLQQKENLLTDEYQKIMAGCEISFDGKTLNLYGIMK
ncbi:MAG: M3 family oligoendopeptidase, partial [Lachnospiraceae bacterium]|nr:M3 family oligoendopeptidase [Lachnospiraceae bacterium]